MDGLKMDFLSSKALEDKSSMEKISMIIDRVKDGYILATLERLIVSDA